MQIGQNMIDSLEPTALQDGAVVEPVLPIGKEQVLMAGKTLQDYKAGKTHLEQRIIENERWYKLRHWDAIRSKQAKRGEAEPTSAWLFNSLSNKHADAMDNFPEPNVLPREQGDEPDAKQLASIVPVVMERNDFEDTYSRAWWYKLKQGCAAYGVFWDSSKNNGLGDISVKKLDLLNLFWQPGVTDIQDSENLFIVSTVTNDLLKAAYPQLKGTETTTLTVAEYLHDENISKDNKSVLVDWYYKRNVDGRTILHYAKFVGDELLFSTENEPETYPEGWYAHGRYPVELDVLFPEEDMPTGFGYIDVMRDPQLYIDKLDQIIMLNAFQSGKARYFINGASNINLDDFTDLSKPFVQVDGGVDERNIKDIVVKPLPNLISNHRQLKIEELKETSGNRDFSQGSTNSGVTAAAAIAALQEAGNKLSRDMIKGGYRAYKNLTYMVIELIRQFYDEARAFRIVGEQGSTEYMMYNNERIKGQALPGAFPGQETAYRVPVFDIVVKPQRSNPFSTNAQNELALTLYKLGFFNPANSDASLVALDMMQFDGKQKLTQAIARNGGMFQQLQQAMTILAQLTGVDAPQGGTQGPQEATAKSKDVGTMQRATDNAGTSYGEKMAARATPKV